MPHRLEASYRVSRIAFTPLTPRPARSLHDMPCLLEPSYEPLHAIIAAQFGTVIAAHLQARTLHYELASFDLRQSKSSTSWHIILDKQFKYGGKDNFDLIKYETFFAGGGQQIRHDCQQNAIVFKYRLGN